MKRHLNRPARTCNAEQRPKSRLAGIGVRKRRTGPRGSDKHRMFAHGGIVASGIIIVLATTPALGQLVSSKCCISRDELLTFRDCLSGPVSTQIPDHCYRAGTCVIGFGENQDTADVLCTPDQPGIPDPPRGYCTDWSLEGVEPEYECLAHHNSGFDLFTFWESDGDGDLDLRDVAWFLTTLDMYEPVPRLRQSNAHIVSVECCFPAGELLRIGEGMSGPGWAIEPEALGYTPRCRVGFSEPVEPGDFLYRLCGTGPPDPPGPPDALCTSWQLVDEPVAQMCEVSLGSYMSSFVTFDDDGDGDIDLTDFAHFQIEIGSPTGQELGLSPIDGEEYPSAE